MTIQHTKKQKSIYAHNLMIIFSTSILIALTFSASSEIRSSIISGIKLSIFSVVPAIFPFLLISDFLSSNTAGATKGPLSRFAERILGISSVALPAFIYGSICGFPVGIKIASKLYNRKLISKSECEKLIGCSSNPSPAFVISGIGIGIYGKVKYGIILYAVILASSIITCIFVKSKEHFLNKMAENVKQTFKIADSIKSAAISCIHISSYIIFFSAIIGTISRFVQNDTALALLATPLEITNASKMLSTLKAISLELRLPLTAFSLSFSGLCFALQARSLLPADISMRKYYLMKLSSGAMSFFISYLIFKFV